MDTLVVGDNASEDIKNHLEEIREDSKELQGTEEPKLTPEEVAHSENIADIPIYGNARLIGETHDKYKTRQKFEKRVLKLRERYGLHYFDSGVRGKSGKTFTDPAKANAKKHRKENKLRK